MKKEISNYGKISFTNSYAWFQADWAICGMEKIADVIRHKMKVKDQNKIMDFECKKFEIHPYWSGGCSCGYIKKIDEWENHNPHRKDCIIFLYDVEDFEAIKKYGFGKTRDDILSKFAKPVLCSCGTDDRFEIWAKKNKLLNHSKKCKLCRSNFIHKETGIEIKWHKTIGNLMVSNVERPREWIKIIDDCIKGIK